MIHIPVNITDKLNRRRKEGYDKDSEQDPSLPEPLRDALRVQSVSSFDEPVSEEGDSTLLKFIADGVPNVEDIAVNNVSEKKMQELLASVLNDRDSRILQLRFGLLEGRRPMTLEEVGGEFGLSRERIRQLVIQSTMPRPNRRRFTRGNFFAAREEIDTFSYKEQCQGFGGTRRSMEVVAPGRVFARRFL